MKRDQTISDEEFEQIIKEVEEPQEKTPYQQGFDDGLELGITRGRWIESIEALKRIK